MAREPGRLSSVRGAIGRLVGQAPWGIADQGLISVSNLVVMVLLARAVSQEAFGRFVLVYSALWFVNLWQNGLVSQPHNLVGSRLRGDAYRRYTGSTLIGQAALSSGLGVLVLIGWGVGATSGWVGSGLLLALGPAIVCWQGREFTRRVVYTEGQVGAAFGIDAACYGLQTATLMCLWGFEALNGPATLWAIAAGNALGAFAGLWRIRKSWTPTCRKAHLLENWHVGKWLVGGQLVGGWLSGGLLLYLTAGMLGVAAAGVIQAIHTLFGPGRVLAQATVTMLPIHLSRTANEAPNEQRGLQGEVKRMALWVGPGLGAICLLLAVFSRPILGLVYGEDYAVYGWTMAIYAAAIYMSYLAMIPSSALKSIRATRQLFVNRLIGGLIGLPAGVGLMLGLGLPGAALGYVVTDGVQAWLHYTGYRRLTRKSHPLEPASKSTPPSTSDSPKGSNPQPPTNPAPEPTP